MVRNETGHSPMQFWLSGAGAQPVAACRGCAPPAAGRASRVSRRVPVPMLGEGIGLGVRFIQWAGHVARL